MQLGKAIKTARVNRGMKQAELADALGVSANYLSLLENDKRDPSWKFVCRLADALSTPLPLLVLLAMQSADRGAGVQNDLTDDLLRLLVATS